MRLTFEQQLEVLNDALVEMGAMCESAIANAAKALLEGDLSYAKKAVETDNRIDEKEREIEAFCLKLMLLQQPVARDLRLISSALKMITDMERIGDQARDIAEICEYLVPQKIEIPTELKTMAEEAIHMVTGSVDSFVKKDLALAREIIDYDDVVDDLFFAVRDQLIALIRSNPELAEAAIDLQMICKYFERIGDHATNIAEWVEYSITGRHKERDEAADSARPPQTEEN